MPFVKTTDKWTAAHAMINTWLKDPTHYCGNCDADYDPNNFPCCEDPIIGNNMYHTKQIIDGIRDKQKSLFNEYAADKKKTMRSTVMLPKRLYYLLDNYFKKHDMRLFETPRDQIQFMRRFPMFKVPNRI